MHQTCARSPWSVVGQTTCQFSFSSWKMSRSLEPSGARASSPDKEETTEHGISLRGTFITYPGSWGCHSFIDYEMHTFKHQLECISFLPQMSLIGFLHSWEHSWRKHRRWLEKIKRKITKVFLGQIYSLFMSISKPFIAIYKIRSYLGKPRLSLCSALPQDFLRCCWFNRSLWATGPYSASWRSPSLEKHTVSATQFQHFYNYYCCKCNFPADLKQLICFSKDPV